MARVTHRRTAAIGLALVLLAAGTAESAAQVRAGIQSPLRAGTNPGCRWVQGAAKTIKVCDALKRCREQTVPAQRIWACGTVRD